MNLVRAIPAMLAALVLGAHFLRSGEGGATAACVLAPLVLLSRRAWARPALVALLVGAAGLWVAIAHDLVGERRAAGEPWLRMAAILGGVALITLASCLPLFGAGFARWCGREAQSARVSLAAFVLTFALLAVVQVKVALPMVLLERFVPGGGWLAALGLACWAAVVAGHLLDPRESPRWRRRIWLLFSCAFFGQLLLGLLVDGRFLLTGALHLPVPAVILAGPVFRGEGLFMPILFAVTVLLVGPAWCSHLCYLGAWDQLASDRRKHPAALPAWTRVARMAMVPLVVLGALGMRLSGASVSAAAAIGLAFGLAGVAIMVAASRRLGVMAHCAVWCPMGLVADLLGRLSPLRLRIAATCTRCGACGRVCRVDALREKDLEAGRPGLACTLCGDCVGSCKSREISLHFLSLSPERARALFVILVAAGHAVFLGVARI
jgi:polyferredoxin